MTAQTEHRLKIALWCVPLIFSAGSFWAVSTVNNADVSERVEQVEDGLKIHTALKAHPVTEERLSVILAEQRDIRTEQKIQGQNLAAICSATGARCK
jgi:hypothetical protein